MTIYKKLLLVLLIVPLFLVGQSLSAESVNWTNTNAQNEYYYFNGTFVNISEDVTNIIVDFPNTSAAYVSVDNLNSKVKLNYTVDSVSYVKTVFFSDLSQDCQNSLTTNAICDIPLTDPTAASFGVYGLIDSIEFEIVVDFSVMSNTSFYNTTIVNYGFGGEETRRLYWDVYDNEAPDIIVSQPINVFEDTTNFNVYIPTSPYHREFLTNTHATLEFYREDTPVFFRYFEVDLQDVTVDGEISGSILIDVQKLMQEESIIYENLDFTKQHYFIINIPQYFPTGTAPAEYNEYLNTSIYTLNQDLKYCIYMVDGVRYETVLFNQIPLEVSDPTKTDHDFKGWYTVDGLEYKFDRVITNDDLLDDTLYLYAKFDRVVGIDIIQEEGTPDSLANNLLGAINLNNTFGYILVYVIVLIVVVGFLSIKKLPVIVMAIAWALITALWVYLGLLPNLILILVILIIAIIVLTYKGGI